MEVRAIRKPPGLAGNFGIGENGALGRGTEGVGLKPLFGREPASPRGLVLETAWPATVFVAIVVAEAGGEVLRCGKFRTVELRRAIGGRHMRADDPLQVDLQRPVVECLAECFAARGDLREDRVADEVVIDRIETESAREI